MFVPDLRKAIRSINQGDAVPRGSLKQIQDVVQQQQQQQQIQDGKI